MNIPIGVLFGIIAMLGWGIADFFVVLAVRKTSVLRTLIWSQIVGLILFFLIFSFFFKLPEVSNAMLALFLITALAGTLGYLAFYKGFQLGKAVIVSPVAASWGAIAAILSMLFLGERLSTVQTVGVILAIAGTILASFKLHNLVKLNLNKLAAGAPYAIAAALGWGLFYFFIDILVEQFSWFIPIFFLKTVGVLYLLAYSGATGKKISFPKKAKLFIPLIGVLEAVAILSYGLGVTSEYTAIVAPVASTYTAPTIILASIFLKETLEANQKVGVISVLAGLVLLSL